MEKTLATRRELIGQESTGLTNEMQDSERRHKNVENTENTNQTKLQRGQQTGRKCSRLMDSVFN